MTFLHRMTLKKHKMTWHSVLWHVMAFRDVPWIKLAQSIITWRNIAYFTFTEIFSWESKVILDCFGFASFRYMIGPENSPHVLNQSDSTLKPTRFGHFPCYDWLLIEPHNEHRINAWHFMTWSNFAQKTWYYQLRYVKYFCIQAIGLSASQDRIFPG